MTGLTCTNGWTSALPIDNNGSNRFFRAGFGSGSGCLSRVGRGSGLRRATLLGVTNRLDNKGFDLRKEVELLIVSTAAADSVL